MPFVRKWPSKFSTFAKAGDGDLREQAEALATKLEPQVQSAVQAYLQEIGDGVQLQALVDALESGDQAEVLAVVAQASQAAAAKAGLGVAETLQGAVWAGGALVAPQVPTLNQAVFSFDRLNPALVKWLQEYHLGLIQKIDEQTREAVRDRLVAGMTSGKGPLQQAVEIKEVIGLTPRQAAAVASYRKELESWHEKTSAAGYGLGTGPDKVNGHNVFRPDETGAPKDGVTQRRLRDRRFDGVLQRALDSRKPLTPEQINRQVAAYQRKYVKHRAQTIARTESLRATNTGVQDAWRQAIETEKVSESQVRRLWIVTHDDRLCSICAPIPKMNKGGVGFAEEFDTPDGPYMLPPIHPACRCTVHIVTIEPGQEGYVPGAASALGRVAADAQSSDDDAQ